ncbi:hypothetical protein BDP55DRAFT_674864 [Colletotrichum godetiae]|uniref:Uncharacterized protein n=1 Tax=Colletotrichum godetiae TaxID=1209918 RepID=A0AAJ0ERY7_9PEZI|nr:uncharacterized protein BDP55DRAFT_674864 [Colletotrichum godetiae]KAK1671798.1 hypothetical protein BDP55DRAFT_674864 [Colletotrichum godetiae]
MTFPPHVEVMRLALFNKRQTASIYLSLPSQHEHSRPSCNISIRPQHDHHDPRGCCCNGESHQQCQNLVERGKLRRESSQ